MTLRPVITLQIGELERIVDEAETALIGANRGLYQRADAIVSVGDAKAITADGEVRVRRIFERGEHALLEDLGVAARFEKFDGRVGGMHEVDAPMKVVKTLRQRTGRLRFPVLSGVIDAPSLRADGSLIDRPGYDQRTGLLYEPGSAVFPPVPPQPSLAEARKAADLLLGLIDSFPFVGEADKSVALAAMLTSVSRRALRTAPVFCFTAPAAGSGKSLLVDITSVLATGREAAVMAQGTTEEELQKRLGAMLLAGDALISIDNCECPVGGEFLCQLLTQPTVRVRILGRSEAPELPTNAFIAATGNNLRLAGDMTRRALLCNLDPQVERPELRTFTFNPIAVAKAQRGDYVCAALTMMRAYIAVGRPRQADPLGSFEEWSYLVRNTLLWLGFADPVDTIEQARACDPRLDELNAVMTQWEEVLGDVRHTVRQVISKATEKRPTTSSFEYGPTDFVAPDFREALLAVAGGGGSINSKRLGKWLASNKRRIVAGRQFEQAGMLGGVVTWELNTDRHPGAFGAFGGFDMPRTDKLTM